MEPNQLALSETGRSHSKMFPKDVKSSEKKYAHNAHNSGQNFESIRNLSAVQDLFLMLSLILRIVFVRWMLRISDSIKNNEFELLFFTQTCCIRKKPSVSSSQYILWFY